MQLNRIPRHLKTLINFTASGKTGRGRPPKGAKPSQEEPTEETSQPGTSGSSSKDGKSATNPQSAKKTTFRIPRTSSSPGTSQTERDLGEERDLKFNMENKFIVEKFVNHKTLLPSETSNLFDKFSKLIMYSVTTSTWKKHMSAWNSLKNFCEAYDIKLKLPLNVQYARAFCTWILTVKNLKPSTIENYLSSITVIHNLGGLQCENFMRDRFIASVLKGGTNISF